MVFFEIIMKYFAFTVLFGFIRWMTCTVPLFFSLDIFFELNFLFLLDI